MKRMLVGLTVLVIMACGLFNSVEASTITQVEIGMSTINVDFDGNGQLYQVDLKREGSRILIDISRDGKERLSTWVWIFGRFYVMNLFADKEELVYVCNAGSGGFVNDIRVIGSTSNGTIKSLLALKRDFGNTDGVKKAKVSIEDDLLVFRFLNKDTIRFERKPEGYFEK